MRRLAISFIHALRRSGPNARWPLAIALVATCGVLGAYGGLADAKSWIETDARLGRELDAQITYVEDVSTLSDLDARSSGTWDRYKTETNDTAVVKGGLTRHFRSLGPSVYMNKGEASYATTQSLDIRLCRLPTQVLRESPLAGRIEIAWADQYGAPRERWRPIVGEKEPCFGFGSTGLISFRVKPQDVGARIRTGDISASGDTHNSDAR